MKVLHISYAYGTQGGGATAAATRLHLSMLMRGVDSRLVCVWGYGDAVCCLRTGIWWMGVRLLHALTGKWTHRLDLPGFDRMVRDFNPDEVHVHWIRHDVISWRQLKKLSSPKLFIHLHDLWPLEQNEITSLKPTFVAYSNWVYEKVKHLGYAVERRELILDPVFSPSPVHLPPPPKVILFGCKDGRANPDKGFMDLSRALSLLPETTRNTLQLRIFGESAPDCMTSGVRTVFLGRIDEPVALRDEYRAASCFAFPSLHETMGMTKLEALACGCPVVAFDREACAEGIVHGKTGYVAKDVADFAKGLEKYLAV